MASTLDRLAIWYRSQCDGDWEHTCGISIRSCDNPGWWVVIDLAGTALQDRAFTPISHEVDVNQHPVSEDWLHCQVRDGHWEGAGDSTKLEVIVESFLEWAACEL